MKDKHSNIVAMSSGIVSVVVFMSLPYVLFYAGMSPLLAGPVMFVIGLAIVMGNFKLSWLCYDINSPWNRREKFLEDIKILCIFGGGYSTTNWDCGVHDWDEMYNIGYRDAQEAFEYALQCE